MYTWVAIILWLNVVVVPFSGKKIVSKTVDGIGTLVGLVVSLPPAIWFTINFWHMWF